MSCTYAACRPQLQDCECAYAQFCFLNQRAEPAGWYLASSSSLMGQSDNQIGHVVELDALVRQANNESKAAYDKRRPSLVTISYLMFFAISDFDSN